jgi:hypothetical protein
MDTQAFDCFLYALAEFDSHNLPGDQLEGGDSRFRLTLWGAVLVPDAGEISFTVFERTFEELGLPQGIRTDNGGR